MKWLLLLVPLLAASPSASPSAAPPAAEPSPEASPAAARPKITVRWKTSSELDNYGFFVTRGESAEGPFLTLNPKPIPGAGNSDVPRTYLYEDFAVEPGKTYFYAVDSVSTRGVRERFSPVFSKLCCTVPSPAPSPGGGGPR